MTTPSVRRLYLVAGISLLATVFIAFLSALPDNGAAFDDWVYPFYADIRSLRVFGSNREFGMLEMLFSEILLPGRPQLYHYLTMLNVTVAGLLMFHLMRRFLPRHRWFALFYALVFVLYIPNNLDHARALYAGNINSWATVLGIGAFVLLVEYVLNPHRLRWLLILIGAILGYMAVRAFESWIPILVIAPALLLFVRSRWQHNALIGLCIWYLGIILGSIPFLMSFLGSEANTIYQSGRNLPGFSTLIPEMLFFYQQSFPLDRLLDSLPNYFAPSLLLMLVFFGGLFLCWRLTPQYRELPKLSAFGWMILVGLIFVGLAGVAGAYAGFPFEVYRFNYFAAPAQALVVVGVVGLLSQALASTLHIRPMTIFWGFVLIYSLLAGHWFFNAQRQAELLDAETRSFNESLDFFRDVVALAPQVTPHTLMLYHCDKPDLAYSWSFIDGLGAYYLYDNNDIRLQLIDFVEYGATTITYDFPIPFFQFDTLTYGYDELIIFACTANGLRILDIFPDGIQVVPTDAHFADYNPHARIQNGFPSPKARRILGL